MKLLPLTLTLFDKVTNNTYKGTVMLKNLNSPGAAENSSNVTGVEGEVYDGKGAGLFIILVISVYALSIVLFIASFITKKSGVGESLNEESTVTTYLHKVGDLKEKTAREHFKKLKMSIISKVEADSRNRDRAHGRGRKGSKGAKDMSAMSRTSSKSSLGDSKLHVDRPKSSNGTEQIPSTGLLPREDDAKQPLLAADPCETPTPPVHDTLSPTFESWNPQVRSASPSLRRTNSPRTLSIIKEQDNEDSDSSRKKSMRGNAGLKRKAGRSIDNMRELEIPDELSNEDDSDEIDDSECESPGRAMSDTELMIPSMHSWDVPGDRSASLGRDVNPLTQMEASSAQFMRIPKYDPKIQRPRPKHSVPLPETYEDVWEQMPQKLMPPPKQRGIKNPKNLYVQIPQNAMNPSDVWVLRNNQRRAVFIHERSPSPDDGRGDGQTGERQQQVKPVQTPTQRPTTLEGNTKLRRSRSEHDRPKRDLSPPDQRSMFLSPQENLNLPRPFRTPSPRTPNEQFSLRIPEPRSVPSRDPQGSYSSQFVPQSPESMRDGKDKAVVRITLDRSPDEPDQGWANGAYDQSPRPRSQRSEVERRDRTPPRFTFTDGASNLEVQRAQFPVTFNSPGFPRRKEERL